MLVTRCWRQGTLQCQAQESRYIIKHRFSLKQLDSRPSSSSLRGQGLTPLLKGEEAGESCDSNFEKLVVVLSTAQECIQQGQSL